VITSLDLLREATGADAGPELVTALTDMPLDRLDEVVELLLDSPPVPAVVPGQTEVWPLVTARASTFASGGGSNYTNAAGPTGLNLNAALNPRYAGSGRFSAGVLRALLYCHGLLIEDPLVMAAEMYQGTGGEVRQIARLAVTAAAASLVEIADLLDGEIVQTFFTPTAEQHPVHLVRERITGRLKDPTSRFSTDDVWEAFESTIVDGLSRPLQELWRRIRAGDRSPPLDLVRLGLAHDDAKVVKTFIDVVAELRPRAVIDNAVDMVASALAALDRLGGRHDLLCSSPLFAKLLFVGSADPEHELRLHELSRVDVPGIDQLLVRDVVRIRQTNAAFAKWRTHLSLGLERAHRLRHELGPDVNTTAAVAEVIADARDGLFREARRSRVLSSSLGMAFVAGALGGAVGGASSGLVGTLLGAAGGAIGPIAQSVSQARRVPEYVRRHYLVFEKTAPVG